MTLPTPTQRDPPRNPGYGDTEARAEALAAAMKERLGKEQEQPPHEN